MGSENEEACLGQLLPGKLVAELYAVKLVGRLKAILLLFGRKQSYDRLRISGLKVKRIKL